MLINQNYITQANAIWQHCKIEAGDMLASSAKTARPAEAHTKHVEALLRPSAD